MSGSARLSPFPRSPGELFFFFFQLRLFALFAFLFLLYRLAPVY